MASLDNFVKTKPNASPGFLESLIMLNSLDVKELATLPTDEKQRHWDVAKKYAHETIEKNKEKLKQSLISRKAILKSKQQKQSQRKAAEVNMRSKIVTEISNFGGEWMTAERIDKELAKLRTENQKKKCPGDSN